MATDIDANVQLTTVSTYFKKIGAGDPTVFDFFTDNVQIFFPKFGLVHGKISLMKLLD